MNEFIDDLQSQLEDDPSSRIFYKLGELFRREGRAGKAAEVLRQGLEHHPRYVAAWVALGRAQVAMGDHEAAEASFARAQDLDPENPVAARLLGESAATRGDWLRAVKGLKLARALSPGDEALDDRIAEVERHLADAGQLRTAPGQEAASPEPPSDTEQPTAAAGEEPLAEPFVADTPEEDAGGDLPGDDEDPFAITQEDAFSPAQETALPGDDVFMLADDEGDPFAVTASADSGIWEAGEDVFTEEAAAEIVEAEDEPEPMAAAAEAGATEPSEGTEAPPFELSHALVEEPEEAEPEETWTADGDEEAAAFAGETVPGELPLPTLTLARLAVDQGDLDLAEKTLRSLLARDPGHDQAAELLREVLDQGPKTIPLDAATRLLARKVSALQGWLQGIRLAAERSAR